MWADRVVVGSLLHVTWDYFLQVLRSCSLCNSTSNHQVILHTLCGVWSSLENLQSRKGISRRNPQDEVNRNKSKGKTVRNFTTQIHVSGLKTYLYYLKSSEIEEEFCLAGTFLLHEVQTKVWFAAFTLDHCSAQNFLIMDNFRIDACSHCGSLFMFRRFYTTQSFLKRDSQFRNSFETLLSVTLRLQPVLQWFVMAANDFAFIVPDNYSRICNTSCTNHYLV